jgi:predicted nicotinamide N-methyase
MARERAGMIAQNSDSRRRFIAQNTVLSATPFVPEIRLHLASDSTELWEKTESELGEIGLPPPFWAFAWAGGQALARYILDNPGIVRGKRILAVAAMQAGASHVTACEIDAFAVDAIGLNADANDAVVNAQMGDFVDRDDGWDVVLAGDVSYERDMTERVTRWLHSLHARGAQVLIGDPGRTYLARGKLESLAEYDVPVIRDLEDADTKKTLIWRFR